MTAATTTRHRSNALSAVLGLTHRLAEDYATLPLSVVTRCVQTATSAVRLFGEDVTAAIGTVESLARADLDAIVEQMGLLDQPLAS